jgi:hypothetical protein
MSPSPRTPTVSAAPRLCAPLLQELQEKAEKQRKRLINTKNFPAGSCRKVAGKLQGMRYPI